VIWSKPDDPPFREKLPALGGEKEDEFMVLMLDGSVHTLPANIKPDLLRILIDTQDGMVIPGDLFDDRRRPAAFPTPGAGGAVPKSADRPVVKEEEQQAAVAKERAGQAARVQAAQAAKRLAEAHAVLDESRLILEREKRGLAEVEDSAARIAELFKAGGATQADVDKAKTEVAAARIKVSARATQVLEAEERLLTLKRELDKK
jgi:hypothetical protein